MTENALIGVTGATGYVGRHVASQLSARGIAQRLIVRDPARVPPLPDAEIAVAESYSDTKGMRHALRGVKTLFLVSGREAPDRVQQHMEAIDAAIAAGVDRIVYLSALNAAPDATFTFARQHFHTEQHIRSTGVRFTFLRDALYIDYVPLLVGEDGVIRGPAGDGRAALVSRDDVANVVAEVLLGDDHNGKTYDVVGREALSMRECAAILAEVTGRDITFQDETVAEAWESRAQYGAPDFEVDGWISTYTAIARGEAGPESDIVFRLTGKEAQTLRDFLRLHPETYRHLLPAHS